MKIGLHDADKDHLKGKAFPNYALMKISAYYKSRGHHIEWWNPLLHYDHVYSSKVFDFTPNNQYLPDSTVRGGTGYKDIPMEQQLPKAVDDTFPDYSIYPYCDYAIGYMTRGCPNHCRWCVVPRKEGQIKPYRKWKEIVRPDTNKLVLMDNNILASQHGVEQLSTLIDSKYKIDLNQGMDARLVTKDVAQMLSLLKWIRFIRFSCDQKTQIESIIKTINLLGQYGVRPYRIFIYLLVTADIMDAAERVEELRKYKAINLYAQAERNDGLGITPNRLQLEFAQRYIYGHCYRKETWSEYLLRKNLLE